MKTVPNVMKTAASTRKPYFCRLTLFRRLAQAIHSTPPMKLPVLRITSAWTDVLKKVSWMSPPSSLVFHGGEGPVMRRSPHVFARKLGLLSPIP